MDLCQLSRPLMALAQGVGIVGVVLSSFSTAKYGIRAYSHYNESTNTTVALMQNSALTDLAIRSRRCETCYWEDLDGRLLDYYGRPVTTGLDSAPTYTLTFDQPSASKSVAEPTDSSTPQPSTSTAETSHPKPGLFAPGESYFWKLLSMLEIMLSFYFFPYQTLTFVTTNGLDSGVTMPQFWNFRSITCRVCSAIWPKVFMAFFGYLQRYWKKRGVEGASSEDRANALAERVTEIIRGHHQDPAAMMTAMHAVLVAQYGDACTLKTTSEEGEARQLNVTTGPSNIQVRREDEEKINPISSIVKDTFQLRDDSEEQMGGSQPRDAYDNESNGDGKTGIVDAITPKESDKSQSENVNPQGDKVEENPGIKDAVQRDELRSSGGENVNPEGDQNEGNTGIKDAPQQDESHEPGNEDVTRLGNQVDENPTPGPEDVIQEDPSIKDANEQRDDRPIHHPLSPSEEPQGQQSPLTDSNSPPAGTTEKIDEKPKHGSGDNETPHDSTAGESSDATTTNHPNEEQSTERRQDLAQHQEPVAAKKEGSGITTESPDDLTSDNDDVSDGGTPPPDSTGSPLPGLQTPSPSLSKSRKRNIERRRAKAKKVDSGQQ